MELFKSKKKSKEKRKEECKEQERIKKLKVEQKKYEERLKRALEIAPEYLLTIPAETYIHSVGKELSDYLYRSIDCTFNSEFMPGEFMPGEGYKPGSLREIMAGLEGIFNNYPGEEYFAIRMLECKRRIIEKGLRLSAEVVTDLKPSIASSNAYLSSCRFPIYLIGTGLVPKKEE